VSTSWLRTENLIEIDAASGRRRHDVGNDIQGGKGVQDQAEFGGALALLNRYDPRTGNAGSFSQLRLCPASPSSLAPNEGANIPSRSNVHKCHRTHSIRHCQRSRSHRKRTRKVTLNSVFVVHAGPAAAGTMGTIGATVNG
jgi:hypothetical protein